MSKTIAEKLLIKPHSTVWLSDPARLTLLTPMPDGVREVETLAAASTAVLFAEDGASAMKMNTPRTIGTERCMRARTPGGQRTGGQTFRPGPMWVGPSHGPSRIPHRDRHQRQR